MFLQLCEWIDTQVDDITFFVILAIITLALILTHAPDVEVTNER